MDKKNITVNKRTKFTQGDIDAAKIMLDQGLSVAQVAAVLRVSYATIYTMKRANFDFEEYRLLANHGMGKKKELAEVTKSTDDSENSTVLKNVCEQLVKMNDTLLRIEQYAKPSSIPAPQERRGIFKK